MTPSPEGWPTKAKETPSGPAGYQPSILMSQGCLGDKSYNNCSFAASKYAQELKYTLDYIELWIPEKNHSLLLQQFCKKTVNYNKVYI